jgi:transposase-like protein
MWAGKDTCAMTANLQNPIFTDETKAREWLEARVWPNGPVCPHCGATGDDVTALQGKAHRPGLYQCSQCREQFTVTVKTVFERSKIPLSKWLAALFLLTASKKGVSAHQVHRSLGISYKSSWFMMHRLREALRTDPKGQLGGPGKIVEADETFFVNRKGAKVRKGYAHKMAVMSLVERDGPIRSVVLDNVNRPAVEKIIRRNVHHESRLMTDAAGYYKARNRFGIAEYETVNHEQGEYAHGDVHVNTLEGYYSIFKRGMKGVYQHCGEQHLHRYVSEFDFRYNTRTRLGFNDLMRAEKAVEGIKGKRLTYRRSSKVAQSSAN